MHDLDGTAGEFSAAFDATEGESFEGEAFESEEEAEIFDDTETGGPFTEEEEIELASELLTVSDDAELDQFLGKLFKRASRLVRKVVKSPVVRSLARMARPFIKKALPMAAGALGQAFGIPAPVGMGLGSFAGNAFGLELEGLAPEDAELEVARRTVRLLGDATQKAAQAAPTASPDAVAKAAMVSAAHKHAPGLAREFAALPRSRTPRYGTPRVGVGFGRGRTGRWFRRGNKILVVGA